MSISLELLVSQLCKSEQGNNTSSSNNSSSTGTGVNTSTVYETLGRQIDRLVGSQMCSSMYDMI